MEEIQKKFVDDLIESEKLVQNADYLAGVVMPTVKDAKVLVRALESVYKSVKLNVNTILKIEFLYKRIVLGKDAKENMGIFYDSCASRYGLTDADKRLLREIFYLERKHKESGFEFSRSGKVIILDDELGLYELTREKMKDYIALAKRITEGTRSGLKGAKIA